MGPDLRPQPLRFRSIWISDLHLGAKACKAEFVLDFLKTTESDYLYLVGDIIDLWSIHRAGLYWPQSHHDVVRAILGKARRGTEIIYVPGNHDDPLRDYHGLSFGNVIVRRQPVHTTAAGKTLLVLHGDEFDAAVQCSRLAKLCGSHGYEWLLWLNQWVNRVRRRFGFPYWSLAAYLKSRVSKAARHMRAFESAVLQEARRQGVDGVVCGHIHHAEMFTQDGVTYCNDGDWVESCTALAEDDRGALHLLHWADRKQTVKSSHGLASRTDSGDPAA